MLAQSIGTRLSRLEGAAHGGFGTYSVKCTADVDHITTGNGIVFVGAGMVKQEEQRLTALGAGDYVLIINDIPRGVN